MSTSCYNPSCTSKFSNPEARKHHCIKLPACQQHRLRHLANEPALQPRRRVAMEVEDEPDPWWSQQDHGPGDNMCHGDQMEVDPLDTPLPSVFLSAQAANEEEDEDEEEEEEDDEYDDDLLEYGSAIRGGTFRSRFERLREQQRKNGQTIFGPFEDEQHWELVEWIVESGLSGDYVDRLLKLKIVRFSLPTITGDKELTL
jgi:hypothetical protein